MKLRGWKCLGIRGRRIVVSSAFCLMAALESKGQAANGAAGISAATNAVKGYYAVGCTLMYAIGAIVGLIGAVKVYQKWSHGDHDTSKVAAAWFGACIFLVVVAAILSGFFGVS
jgi:Domain of unknown function (DUF4134)